ncbi:MAG: Spy/CpxP family protein refolding chaperone [Candidatus Xenobia bacterium]
MSSINKLMVALALAGTLMAPVAALAQTPGAPAGAPPAHTQHAWHRHGHHHGMRMFKGLHLTPEQKAQLHAMMEVQAPAMKANRQAFKQELESVLTPDQKAKRAAMHQRVDWKTAIGLTAQQESTLENLRGQGKHLSHQAVMQALNLTPEQQAKLQQLHAQRKAERGFKALGLTPDQKAQLKSWREARKPAMEQQRKAFVANVDTILNAQQRTKFHQNLAAMKARWQKHNRQQG